MNLFQEFKPEIKLFLIVALIAVVISVGGILLLGTIQSLPDSSPGGQSAIELAPQNFSNNSSIIARSGVPNIEGSKEFQEWTLQALEHINKVDRQAYEKVITHLIRIVEVADDSRVYFNGTFHAGKLTTWCCDGSTRKDSLDWYASVLVHKLSMW